MAALGYQNFLKTLPNQVLPRLSAELNIKVHQPFRWMVQFYDRDRRIHYEVQRVSKSKDIELGLHFESKNKKVNAHFLQGFSRRMFEVHAQLGDSIAADPWDRGWAKVYAVAAAEPITEEFQVRLGTRLADMITCLHPLLLDIYAEPVPKAAPTALELQKKVERKARRAELLR